MRKDDLLSEYRSVSNPNVYYVGCLEQRVTFYAQQARALNLVIALTKSNAIRRLGKVAIIGGGVAGATTAAALSIVAPNLEAIDLFERKSELLHLQRSSDRFLHPHHYDWPSLGSSDDDAGLPIMNWQTDSAGNVATRLQAAFSEIERHSKIHCEFNTIVTGIEAISEIGCKLRFNNHGVRPKIYDAVILCIGFGYEHPGVISYWAPPSILTGPTRIADTDSQIFISGNGDGGLVDLIMAAFNGPKITHFYKFIINYPGIRDLALKLESIEQAAWCDHTLNIYATYETIIVPILPKQLLIDVLDKLRKDAKIIFHTRRTSVFSRTSAVINRFCALLAIAGYAALGGDRLRLIAGEFDGDPPYSGPVNIAGAETFDPLYRFLRLGPQSAEVRQPFKEHFPNHSEEKRCRESGPRPATPKLNARASDVFSFRRTHSPSREYEKKALRLDLTKEAEQITKVWSEYLDEVPPRDERLIAKQVEMLKRSGPSSTSKIIARHSSDLLLFAKYLFDLGSHKLDNMIIDDALFFESLSCLKAPDGSRPKTLVPLLTNRFTPSRNVLNGGSVIRKENNRRRLKELLDTEQDIPFAATPAMQPAAAAALMLMAEDLDIAREKIDIVAFNGSQMFRDCEPKVRSGSTNSMKFTIVANGATYFRPIDTSTLRCELAFVCYDTIQRLIRRRVSRNTKLHAVYCVEGTSAAEQAFNKQCYPRENCPPEFVSFSTLIERARKLEPSEAIIAWEPLATGLCRHANSVGRNQLCYVQEFNYKYDVGFQFCDNAFTDNVELVDKQLIVDFFIETWLKMRADPVRGLTRLLKDKLYIDAFNENIRLFE